MKISESEMEIMKIIWKKQRAVKPKEIMEQLDNKDWKYNTVNTFLTRLVEKGLLECQKGYVNYYTAIVTQKEYKRYETQDFLDTIHQGSLRSMLVSLCNQDITDEKLNELLEELEKY